MIEELLTSRPDPGVSDITRIHQHLAGSYIMPGWTGDDTNHALVANTIHYVPIHVTNTFKADKIGIVVTTAVAGSAAGLIIYEYDNGLPGKAILNAGEVLTATTGYKGIVIDYTFVPGTYYLAVRVSHAISLAGLAILYIARCPVEGMCLVEPANFSELSLVIGEAVGLMTDPARVPATYSKKIIMITLRVA